MTTTVVTTAAHHLRLFFLHTYASESAAADAGVQRWQVSAEVLTEDGLPLAHLGDVHLVRADPCGAADLRARLSIPDLGLAEEAEASLGSGRHGRASARLTADARPGDPLPTRPGELATGPGAFTAGPGALATGGLLFVTDARLCPEWSGLGLGVAMCGLALRELRFGCHQAICHPGRARRAAEASPGWGYAREELIVAWPRLGFRPLAGEVLALDLTGDAFPRLVDRLLAGHDPPW